MIAGRPSDTFWKATEKVLEGLENNCEKSCMIQIFFVTLYHVKRYIKSNEIKREPATRCSWLDDSLIP